MERPCCKHYKDGYCYSQEFLDSWGWEWLKKEGRVEVPSWFEVILPTRAAPFRIWHTCENCRHWEKVESES